MAEEKPSLLIVEDDVDVADMLEAYFRVQGYEVFNAYGGEQAIQLAQSCLPNLVILDIRLPDFDGYEVARRLRSNRRTKDLPILFLTEKRNRSDRLQGLELGADDYITKPFDIQELRLRVRNALRRVAEGSLTNPVTGLPEGALVDERLRECLVNPDWAILIVRLDNLDAFHEAYGFVASDDVMRAISLMVRNIVRESSQVSDFIGQLGSHHLIIFTRTSHQDALSEQIQQRLTQSMDYFYPLKDRTPTNHPGKRLRVTLHSTDASAGSFTSVDELKNHLL